MVNKKIAVIGSGGSYKSLPDPINEIKNNGCKYISISLNVLIDLNNFNINL